MDKQDGVFLKMLKSQMNVKLYSNFFLYKVNFVLLHISLSLLYRNVQFEERKLHHLKKRSFENASVCLNFLWANSIEL